MSTIAATAAEPAASTQVVPTTIVEVEEDPSMKEQLADQAEKVRAASARSCRPHFTGRRTRTA